MNEMQMNSTMQCFIRNCCGIFAIVACCSATAQPRLCTGDPALDALAGYYAHTSVIAAARVQKSWPAILASTDAQLAGLIIKDRSVRRALAWHESDSGSNCIEVNGEDVFLKAEDEPKRAGAYRRLATIDQNESWSYLNLFASGCYAASNKTRWCISKSGITVDSKPLAVTFSLDTMEQPGYGTALKTGDERLPFLVLVPSPVGFRVFRDTWLSDEKRKPVYPARDKPWLTLKRVQ